MHITEAEFEVLFLENRSKVMHVISRIWPNHADAEEVTQDVFLRIWTRRDSFRGQCKFSTWLHVVARNEALRKYRSENALRRKHSAVSIENSADDMRKVANLCRDPAPNPEQEFAIQERNLALARAIGKLPARYRKAMQLRYQDEQSLKEVKDAMGIHIGCAKSYLYRGREQARQRFEAFTAKPARASHKRI